MAALLYCTTAGIFIYYESYVQSWVLYMGNALFGMTIAFFLYKYYKRSNYSLKITQLIVAGGKTIIAGVIISCIICVMLLLIFEPGFFLQAANANNVLKNPPAQLQHGKNGYLLVLLMDAVIGNMGAGSFIAVIFPFTLSRDEKDE